MSTDMNLLTVFIWHVFGLLIKQETPLPGISSGCPFHPRSFNVRKNSLVIL